MFGSLAIGASYSWTPIEGKSRLTGLSVRAEVKLRDEEVDRPGCWVNLQVCGQRFHACPNVLVPLACYVVRDVDDREWRGDK